MSVGILLICNLLTSEELAEYILLPSNIALTSYVPFGKLEIVKFPTPFETTTLYDSEPIISLTTPSIVEFSLMAMLIFSSTNAEYLSKVISVELGISSPVTFRVTVLEMDVTYLSSPANTALII